MYAALFVNCYIADLGHVDTIYMLLTHVTTSSIDG